MKVLSCVPQQTYCFADKLRWLDRTAAEFKPDLFVAPQEYVGGVQALFFKTGEPLHYTEAEVTGPFGKLAKKHKMTLAIGALIFDATLRQVRERIYLISSNGKVAGHYDKMMLPAYDINGLTNVYPETDFGKRAQCVEVDGMQLNIMFCWEVWSNYIWHALCKSQPDMLLSMIKFGVAGWPQKGKDTETGKDIVAGFGFGDDGGWTERLRMGSRYDLCAPIVCSTNSWDLPKKAKPLAGVIYPFDDKLHPDALWYPPKGDRGNIVEHVQVDEINPLEWRYARENKFTYKEAVGDWPSSAIREHTMMWKVRRMERVHAGLRSGRVKKLPGAEEE